MLDMEPVLPLTPLITIDTERLNEMAVFYQERIGMKPMHEIRLDEGFAMLHGHGIQLLLQKAGEEGPIVRNHISMSHADISRLYEELTSKGVGCLNSTDDPGSKLQFIDLDGNRMDVETGTSSNS